MNLTAQDIQTSAGPAHVIRGGTGEPAVFLHGGTPGVSPYAAGAHLWARALPLFARDRTVIAPDLPGSGKTKLTGDADYGIEGIARHTMAIIESLKLGPVHLVGHDTGGLAAIWLAFEAPHLVRSLVVTACMQAAPTGDGFPNYTLAYVPNPKWSRASQAWVLERISFTHHQIDAPLLNACVAAAEGDAHKGAVKLAADGGNERLFAPSVARGKGRLYAACRDKGVPVPIQLIWGSHDPITNVNQGMTLFKIVAPTQSVSHFHVINRAGNLPFHEEPGAFHHLAAGFMDGAPREAARLKAG
ncbi:MAG: alpha/beta fold hydrolase [Alphaproteobacteria bacterium]